MQNDDLNLVGQQKNGQSFDFSFSKDKIFSRYIPSAIFILFALFAYLACAFALGKINIAFDRGKYNMSMTGFGFLSSSNLSVFSEFAPEYASAGTGLGFICWITFLSGTAALIVGVLTMFMTNDRLMKKIRLITIIVCLIILLIYMICGIVLVSEMKKAILKELAEDLFSVKISSFVPFMLCSIFAIAYFVYPIIAKSKIESDVETDGLSPKSNVRQSGAPAKSHSSTMEKITLLKEYKILLDSGIITEEEFNEKKKEILD